MDNTRVNLTEYYRGNSLRKELGRIKKYIVFKKKIKLIKLVIK